MPRDTRLMKKLMLRLAEERGFEFSAVVTACWPYSASNSTDALVVRLHNVAAAMMDDIEEARAPTLTTAPVTQAILTERAYQDRKFGKDKPQSLPGWLIIMENELIEAKAGWTKNSLGRHSALHEIVQLTACALRCLEFYGTEGTARATNDEPDSSQDGQQCLI